mgnify:CR=1 FL=1
MPLNCKFFSLLLLVHYLHALEIQYAKDNDSPCNCKSIFECESLKAFLDRREFAVLRSHKSCGFEMKVPKYCCPSVESITPKPKTLSTTTQNPREAYFADLKKLCGLNLIVKSAYRVGVHSSSKKPANSWSTPTLLQNSIWIELLCSLNNLQHLR